MAAARYRWKGPRSLAFSRIRSVPTPRRMAGPAGRLLCSSRHPTAKFPNRRRRDGRTNIARWPWPSPSLCGHRDRADAPQCPTSFTGSSQSASAHELAGLVGHGDDHTNDTVGRMGLRTEILPTIRATPGRPHCSRVESRAPLSSVSLIVAPTLDHHRRPPIRSAALPYQRVPHIGRSARITPNCAISSASAIRR